MFPPTTAFHCATLTRNFPNREGSKPGEGQFAGVCLMDARSIAATALNGGKITAATDIEYECTVPEYEFDSSAYDRRIYYGFGKADPSVELVMGPNITDWPKMYALTENLLVKLAAVIHDPVTTTDELIPPEKRPPIAATLCALRNLPCQDVNRHMSAERKKLQNLKANAAAVQCRRKLSKR